MAIAMHSKINITAPSTALQQLCNMVAIAETKDPAESLRELILHTLFTFDDGAVCSANDVGDIVRDVFGLDVPSHQVQESLDRLTTDGQIHKPAGTNIVLTSQARTRVKDRIDRASEIEEKVRAQWLSELEVQFPGLDTTLAWAALKAYLAKAFIRHGIQVANFLDPSVNLPKEYAASLSTLLAEAVNSKLTANQQEPARHAISDFLANVGNDADRVTFIAECSDGAANYFSLAVAPGVADQLRMKLDSLTLFCDTNFLFGILDLHVHPLVAVSNELLGAIQSHKLPFKLRFHEATLRELVNSIAHYSTKLRRHRWSQSLSRAATSSRFVSGIELKYHEKNTDVGLDVDMFLRPYDHVDILLKDRGIVIYRPTADRLTERATLESEYRDFLAKHNKEKPYESLQHDVTVLDCVRSLRGNAKSTLEAASLFVTCDFTLYGFDCESSHRANIPASVVLPNVLWQILRPYIPARKDFDRSFAETFAIPEFRTIGSGASEACSKMLGLLATYMDFPEETATRMLSNDLLIDRLRAARDDRQFQAEVESAIVAANAELLEERAAMEKQNIAMRAAKERAEAEMRRQKIDSEAKIAKAEADLRLSEKEKEELDASKRRAEVNVQVASAKVESLTTDKTDAESRAAKEAKARAKLESTSKRDALIAAFGLSAALIIGFEWLVHGLPWAWLRDHPNSYGLQTGLDGMILSIMLGLLVPRWRKYWWLTVLMALAVVVIYLLGGPGHTTIPTQKTS
jgi:hypothetical protein